jgi:hypothetical protein
MRALHILDSEIAHYGSDEMFLHSLVGKWTAGMFLFTRMLRISGRGGWR